MTDFAQMDFTTGVPEMGIPDLFFTDADFSTSKALDSPRVLKRQAKTKTLNRLKKQKVEAILPDLPKPGEAYHVISNGGFDFWTLASWVIEATGKQGLKFTGSTWILNRENANDLLRLIDEGKIAECLVITGDYFKRRAADIYATIAEGLTMRGQSLKCAKNHAKIILITDDKDTNIVIEGSANWCHNQNIEQYQITNDRELLEFHRDWMRTVAVVKV